MMKNKIKYLVFFIALFAILVQIFVYTGNNYLYKTNDSFSYLEGAENIIKGKGFTEYNINPNTSEVLRRINLFQPLYSYFAAFFIKLFHITSEQSLLIINSIAWIIIFIFWYFLGIRNIQNKLLYICFTILLIFPGYMWEYFMFGLSDILCFSLLSVYFFFCYHIIEENSFKNKLIYSVFAIFFLSASLMTRYAILPFVVIYFIWLLLINDISWKNKFILLATSLVILFSVYLFFINGHNSTGEAINNFLGNKNGLIYDFKRIIFVFNVFVTAVFGFPETIEKLHFIILIPFVFVILYIFRNLKKSNIKEFIRNNSFLVLLSLSIIAYFSEVLIMCLINRGVTRFGGYIRYFSFLVPIFSVLIIILYNYVIDKRLQKIILFIFVILMLGNIYQSSITYGKYINWKQKEDKVQRVMSYIKSIIDHDNTVIISNIGKQTFYYTKISTKEITSMHYLDSNIISLKAQNKDIVFVFNKTYHLDTSWQQFATKIKSYKGQVLWDDDIYFVYK